jgi:hypothetical protein
VISRRAAAFLTAAQRRRTKSAINKHVTAVVTKAPLRLQTAAVRNGHRTNNGHAIGVITAAGKQEYLVTGPTVKRHLIVAATNGHAAIKGHTSFVAAIT